MELIVKNPTTAAPLPAVEWNYQEMRAELEKKLAAYKGAVYTAAQMPQAKKDRATLNKVRDQLDTARKELRAYFLAPYNEFEAQMKELLGLVAEAVEGIDAQVKAVEQKEKDEKQEATAVHNDLCTRNPAKFCRLESIATKHVKEVYSDAEIESASRWFIRRMPEVVLLLETGVRRGELLGWHKDDFSRRKNTWTVSRAVHLVPGKGPCEGPPKCHSGRTAPLSPRGRQAVEILLQMYPDSPMLIPGPTGGIMRPDTWSRRLKAEMARMAEQQPDMPQLTAHELRHTYGTFLRRHGADIYSISKILGHKDVNVTARIYVHNEMDELRRALKFLRKQTLLAV